MIFYQIEQFDHGQFFYSGFLLSFGILRKLNKTNGFFNYFEFIVQRWASLCFCDVWGPSLHIPVPTDR